MFAGGDARAAAYRAHGGVVLTEQRRSVVVTPRRVGAVRTRRFRTARSRDGDATFEDIFGGFASLTADLPPGDKRKLFHDNAARLYRLHEPSDG